MPRGGPRPGQSLGDLYPGQSAEWHPTLNGDLSPFDMSPRNNKAVWWRCGRCGRDWSAIINNRTSKHSINCVVCNRGRKSRIEQQAQQCPPDSIANRAPTLASEWHPEKNAPLTPRLTPAHWDQNIWWTCPKCHFEWPQPPAIRTSEKDRGCPNCATHTSRATEDLPPVEDSLERRNPAIASQWHPTRNRNSGLDPLSTAYDSRADVWWLCQNPNCMHEWVATVKTRALGNPRGCPVCQRPRSSIAAPVDSFASQYQDLLAQWHPTLNGRLDPYSIKPNQV